MNNSFSLKIDNHFVTETTIKIASWSAAGYLYGDYANVSPTLTASILAISTLATCLLHLIIKQDVILTDPAISHRKESRKHIHVAILSNALTILALKHFKLMPHEVAINLIKFTGACFLGYQFLTFAFPRED